MLKYKLWEAAGAVPSYWGMLSDQVRSESQSSNSGTRFCLRSREMKWKWHLECHCTQGQILQILSLSSLLCRLSTLCQIPSLALLCFPESYFPWDSPRLHLIPWSPHCPAPWADAAPHSPENGLLLWCMRWHWSGSLEGPEPHPACAIALEDEQIKVKKYLCNKWVLNKWTLITR